LYDRWRIEQMARHFDLLLQSVIADSKATLLRVQMISDTEQQRLLREWNQTAVDYPETACVHNLF